MANLSEKLKNGVVNNKEMVVVCYDFDGNITSVEKVEYMSNSAYKNILFKQKNDKASKALVENQNKKLEEASRKKEEKIALKQRTLSAFDRWYRDVTNGLTEFNNEMYESVISWYREYLEDNNIETHKELVRYL